MTFALKGEAGSEVERWGTLESPFGQVAADARA